MKKEDYVKPTLEVVAVCVEGLLNPDSWGTDKESSGIKKEDPLDGDVYDPG